LTHKREGPASCGERPLPGGVFISSSLAKAATEAGFEEFVLPSLEPAAIYAEKAGAEVLGQMYVFKDKKGRDLCLRPEGTATCQILADTVLKMERDVKLWYLTTCWRYERPQAGRYREFLQFGIEVLNPRPNRNWREELVGLAENMIKMFTSEYEINKSVKRGLAYYVEDGFEISCPKLGAQKQVCGGGSYKQGIGFAFGVDRLMLL
jgi:histidyl-tRNA synthetase